jgi:hypothetical protein
MTIEHATLLMKLQAKSLRIMREENARSVVAKTQADRNMSLNRIAVHANRIQRINQKMNQNP